MLLQTSLELSGAVAVGYGYWTKVTLAIYVEVVLLFFEAAESRLVDRKLTLLTDICIFRPLSSFGLCLAYTRTERFESLVVYMPTTEVYTSVLRTSPSPLAGCKWVAEYRWWLNIDVLLYTCCMVHYGRLATQFEFWCIQARASTHMVQVTW